MKNRKSYYTAFELFEANILIFKGSNFQISLGYLSILDMVTVNKYAFAKLKFFRMVWKFQTVGREFSSGIRYAEDLQNGISLL